MTQTKLGLPGLLVVVALGVALTANASADRRHLAVCAANPHYLQNAEGKPLFLLGAYAVMNPHLGPDTWRNFVDAVAGRMNYIRLETPLAIDYPWPQPYLRVPGSGLTSNGNEGKFDLTRFNENYWNNLRAFLRYAGQKGLCVHVALFDEIFTKRKPGCCGFGRNAFGNGNNVNTALIGDVDHDNDLAGTGPKEFYDSDALYGRTSDPHRLAVAELQRAWVAKLLKETSDLPNVFYETGNEIRPPADWIEYWVDFIRARTKLPISDDAGEPFDPRTNLAHPVEAATWHNAYVGAGDELFRTFSRADYACGKVLISDTDGAPPGQAGNPEANRMAAWLALVTGGGVWADYAEGIGCWESPWRITRELSEEVRYFGYLLAFLNQSGIELQTMAPHDELTSKGRCLAAPGQQYLVYSRTGGTYTLDLSSAEGSLVAEWYNPRTGGFSSQENVAGGTPRTFSAPFRGDAVLWVHAGQKGS